MIIGKSKVASSKIQDREILKEILKSTALEMTMLTAMMTNQSLSKE